MSIVSNLQIDDIRKFVNPETEKYSVWVYKDSDGVHVYENKMPNTIEIWFRFNKFSHLYWRIFEDECVDEIKGAFYYNFMKVKKFMLSRMIASTNFSDIVIEYGKDGRLVEQSYNAIMSIHPRILRCIMGKVDVFPRALGKNEEREFEKQCSILFGKGEGVQNPHPYITTYCNLVAFWDKFGLNYYDIMSLPQELFRVLKLVMSLENTNKSQAMESMKNSANAKSNNKRNSHSVSF